jgi:[protein-PII] uridylyltransferase
VAPKVYSSWRDTLLSDLYKRALKLLEQGDKEAVDPERRVALVKHQVRELLSSKAPAEAIGGFIETMPERYFLTTPEADFTLHFELICELKGGRSLVCHHRIFAQLEFAEFIVVTPDQPGLFAKIAGVLTANNLNILSARIITSTEGVALDAFRISLGAGGIALEPERWLRVEQDLERVLRSEREVIELVASSLRNLPGGRKFLRRMATEVTVDNRTSDHFTVVDVFSPDRVGLLFTITHTLFELGYVIHLARISTSADQALDVFYVSDSAGHKIEDLERMRQLKATLTDRLEPPQPVTTASIDAPTAG